MHFGAEYCQFYKKDGMDLRRLMAIFLVFSLLTLPARAADGEKLVALTFDDGPSGRFTRRLLEGLAQRGAKATFFLCGYRLEQYPKLSQTIVSQGHEVAVHGYSHRSMCAMTDGELSTEIRETLALLPGDHILFLRPPGGMCNQKIEETAGKFGLAILHWSVDPKDWATNDVNLIVHRVVSQVQDGDVILLHDMSDSSVDAALQIVDILQRKGFRFVTASQLAQARKQTPVPGTIYTAFCAKEPAENK